MKKRKRIPVKRLKRGTLTGWNANIEAMPDEGHFEVLRVYPEVFRHMKNERYVIEPMSGRMFVPMAWRPARNR